ncbi:MAG: glycyl radical protein [Sulfolobales archaeon]|nr:glycyl radical protein [Sulfolobales archaeon]MDW7969848.1 glycyl radical protein [Sulfolobales archaeon]
MSFKGDKDSRALRIKLLKSHVLIDREIDVNRALLVTESYRETEGEPPPIRRAKALRKVLSEMPIHILDGELIVGNQSHKPRAGPLFPEWQVDKILNEMHSWPTRPGDKFKITDEEMQLLRKTLSYWKGKTVMDRVLTLLPDTCKRAMKYGVFSVYNYITSGHGHFVPDFEKVLKLGLNGIKDEVINALNNIDETDPYYYDKVIFYKSLLITADAVIHFAKRYASLARELAVKEMNLRRKMELERVAEICDNVPANPARNFWEALQSVWFILLTAQIEQNGLAVALGRFDQYMYPYYINDVNKGLLDDESALELIEAFYIKTNVINKVYDNEGAVINAGPALGQVITLGGVTRDGEDAVNELTYLCLKADAEVGLMQPDFAIRLHPKISEEFLVFLTKHIAKNPSKVKLFNDMAVIPALINVGVTLEDARDYALLGCSEAIIPGKTCSGGNFGQINLAKCLELALNEGRVMWYYDGKEFHLHPNNADVIVGLPTGNPEEFKTYYDLWDAFRSQLSYAVKLLVTTVNIIDRVQAELTPHPLFSLVTEGCIESGLDFTNGGALYNFTAPIAIGPITVSDSLAAIKYLVFDKEEITMKELMKQLRNNFEGGDGEYLRLRLIHESPKFGNDNRYVDEIASQVIRAYVDEISRYENPRGGRFVASVYSLTGNVSYGWRTGPTPDGRKGGEPLNDNISPTIGRDLKGPTAVIKSLSRIDSQLLPQGYIFNLKFSPSMINDDTKVMRFVSFIRSLLDFGIFHTQFNIISADTLREAQKHPERYRGLLVRVAGYCAYFVELSKEVQDHIIARTEHENV